MAALLSEFIAAAELRDWQLGKYDCLLAIADWVRLRTGKDPAELWRGAYSDPASRLQLVSQWYGILPMMDFGARQAGCNETKDPRRGDVGLIHFHQAKRRVGAICLGIGWWWTPLEKKGALISRDVKPIKCWRVP